MGVDRAVSKLKQVRNEIARIAACWTAAGHDTLPLAEPLVTLQEAIAELESVTPAATPPVRFDAHDVPASTGLGTNPPQPRQEDRGARLGR